MGCQCSKITYLIIPQKPLEIKLVNSQVFFNVLVIFIAERERRIFNFGLGHTCRCTLALSHLKKFQMKSFQLPAPCDCEKTQRASKMKEVTSWTFLSNNILDTMEKIIETTLFQ